jgi:DNA-binding transcriptional LysR family regulator
METILAAIDDAENSVRETGELRGVLRLAMPSTMAVRVVMPRLSAFTERHPLLRLEIMLDDRWQDMVREAVDVGIRVGSLPDSAGTARLIGKMHRVVVAAPDYLDRHGTPATPEDIATHRVVDGPAGARPSSWQFERNGETTSVDVQPHVSTNDTAGALAAAVAGLGIVSTTSWACRSEVVQGTLVQLLPEWKMAELPVHAYFPMGRTTRMAGRAFVDFLAAELGKEPFCLVAPTWLCGLLTPPPPSPRRDGLLRAPPGCQTRRRSTLPPRVRTTPAADRQTPHRIR